MTINECVQEIAKCYQRIVAQGIPPNDPGQLRRGLLEALQRLVASERAAATKDETERSAGIAETRGALYSLERELGTHTADVIRRTGRAAAAEPNTEEVST